MKFTNFRIIRLRRKDLEKLKADGRKTDVEVVGMVYADEDVSAELVRETVSSTRIYGCILGAADVRAALLSLSTI